MEYYSAFLLQLNMEPCFSADTPPLSGIHIKQLSPTFTWHSFRRLSSHLYLARILSLPFHLYMTPFFIFSADIIPPLLVTFTLHLLPYYSTLMWHFHRASPRSISTHLNMVSFSLFLSHLYMTLILFITPRQYYSPQLLQGFSAEGFSRSFSLSTSLSHIFPWLFFR